jgi:hypothetical protein
MVFKAALSDHSGALRYLHHSMEILPPHQSTRHRPEFSIKTAQMHSGHWLNSLPVFLSYNLLF